MAKVGIVMGSDSDMPVMAKAAEILDKFGIDYEMTIISAHREPDLFFKWAKAAIEGNKVVVWSEDITQPVKVRYAWDDNPQEANLKNKAGLPASPFQMDIVK